MTNERRYLQATGLEVRRENDSRQLVGRAVVYDSLSEDMGFRERFASGAFRESLNGGADVRALVDHDAGKIIGRSKAGTLKLTEDRDGIKVVIDPPNTQTGNDVVESVSRGDLSAMSFSFRAVDDSWETVNGESVRTIHKADLFDVSIVAFPSYPDTSIAVRSLDQWQKEQKVMDVEVKKEEVKTEEVKTDDQPERRSAPVVVEHAKRDPAEWMDSHGNEVRVLNHDQKFSDLYKNDEPLSMGRAIRAMIVGDWTGAEAEQRALSTSSNPTAGILIPESLSAGVIDKARALSVLNRAGAKTVDMTTSSLKIARVATDATIAVHAENTAFTATDIEFDAVELTAYTIGAVVKMSRELAADAPNSVSIIEDKLARALAAKIDLYGLTGTGSNQPLGLLNFANTNTNSVATWDWDEVMVSMLENEKDNHESNAMIISPTSAHVLRILKVAAEANHYATPPAAVQALSIFASTAVGDTVGVVGDFSKFLIGLRQSATIEVTTEGGNAFEEHAVYVKVTWRGAFNAEHLDAFCIMDSI